MASVELSVSAVIIWLEKNMSVIDKSMKRLALVGLALTITACGPAIDDSVLGADAACVPIATELFGEALAAENRVHQSFASYVKSKASLEPLVFHQYSVHQEGIPVPVALSCKFKSTESMAKFIGRELESKTCGDINRSIASKVLAKVSGDESLVVPEIVFDEDLQATRGTQYLDPWPFQTLYQQAGVLHVLAKEMFVSSESWAPLPANFKGVQYCHLLSADYFEAVLQGSLKAPELVVTD